MDIVRNLQYLCTKQQRYKTMLTPYKINEYCKEFKPEWACEMPVGCPPENVLVPSEHPFFRLASQIDSYTADDFTGEIGECNEGTLEWIEKTRVYDLNIWEGDKIFFRLLEEDRGFFSLKLVYDGHGNLIEASLDGHKMDLSK